MMEEGLLSKRSKYVYNILLEEEGLASNLAEAGKKVVKLNRGDPAVYFKTPKYMIDAYVKALRSNQTYYSRAEGAKTLINAVIKRYKEFYGLALSEDSIITTEGVSEALYFINSSLINTGDMAVIFRPYYNQYMTTLELHGGRPIFADYDERNMWAVDLDALRKSLKSARSNGQIKRVKYMLVTNPNNPTGTVLSRRILSGLADIANEYGIFLISDEIYDEIIFNGAKFTSISEVAKGMPYAILNGASKNFDATGFRIGFIIIPEHDRLSSELKSKMSDYARMRLSVNTPAQYAVAEGISNSKEHAKAIKEMVSEIEKRINSSVRILRENEYLDVVRPNGAFYIFPHIDIKSLKFRNDKGFVEGLLKEKLLQTARGSGFGSPAHFRIVSLATESILTDSMKKINEFCIKHAR
ncbi:MAG: aminotransferase class I/II-fold pyridoxal phosphate-dependent enzyme [Candidatus Micrarchaeales archaeon]|jgi:Aspartate/tyrosine/aromatic aminotransferase|nr:aminotransferase class I/II-fold pyridoxal phosphate-dependent enzyme [Candidatus Micrarchaeales archaeon]